MLGPQQPFAPLGISVRGIRLPLGCPAADMPQDAFAAQVDDLVHASLAAKPGGSGGFDKKAQELRDALCPPGVYFDKEDTCRVQRAARPHAAAERRRAGEIDVIHPHVAQPAPAAGAGAWLRHGLRPGRMSARGDSLLALPG